MPFLRNRRVPLISSFVAIAVALSLVALPVAGANAADTAASSLFAKAAPIPSTSKPTITGVARVGSTITAQPGAWTTGTTFTYQWSAGTVAIAGATKKTFALTSAQLAKTMTVMVTGAKAGYAATSRSSDPTAAVQRGSLTPGKATISGTPQVGKTLTANPGSWAPQPVTYAYQWFRGSEAITNAKLATYTAVIADIGQTVKVRVTGSKSGYDSASASSAPTVVVRATTPSAARSVAATKDDAARTATMTWLAPATDGGSPITGYLVARDGTDAAGQGAWSHTYPADRRTMTHTNLAPGATYNLSVTPVNGIGRGPTTTVQVVMAPGTLSTATPTVTGTPRVGSVLSAAPGVWGPAPVSLAYQWNRNGAAIGGATGQTYTLTAADAGGSVSVTVTGSKPGYRSSSRSSTSQLVSLGVFTTAPTPSISGSATVGSTLTAAAGAWTPTPTNLAYQWAANGASVAGAQSSSWTVTANEIGKSISVTVTASLAGYATTSRTSATTSPVPTPAHTGVAAERTQRMTSPTLNSTQVGWYEAGATLTLSCYAYGQSVQGHFSPYVGNGGWDSLWYRVDDGYFVADIDLETGTLDPIGDQCAGTAPADSTNATVMATTQRMSAATLNSSQNGSYGQGSRLTLSCYQRGQAVKGYYSPYLPNGGWDDLWYKVDDGYFVADVDIDTGSNDPVTPACSAPPVTNGNTTLERAKSWLDAGVAYNQGLYYSNQYGSYRQDCSGFVSMALGLGSSYVTGTLPQVLTRINKDDLQPGDIMLNTAPGNNGHTAIFVRWADGAHTKYVSWEENGQAGRTIEQVVPYPYWPSWEGSSNYFPYRRN